MRLASVKAAPYLARLHNHLEWIDVAGGWFWMGGGPLSNENPRHRVWVQPFRLARTQVTRADYQGYLLANSHAAPPPFWDKPAFAHPKMPAVGLSWHDASAYCSWLSQCRDEPLRLPTEAEWECAALAGRDDILYPWGDDPPGRLPNYEERWLHGPEPVDEYPSLHPWGFSGLGENVHEWCADWYDPEYYRVSPERRPAGPESGRRRASRGGSWRHTVKVSRCAARSSIPPDLQYSDYGLRLASG